jgi:glycosyltransferase involved in cell wall biosynthesis
VASAGLYQRRNVNPPAAPQDLGVRILFLHQNFPGQFLHVADALRNNPEHELLAVVPESHKLPRLIPTRTYPFDPLKARTNIALAGHYTDRIARAAAVAGVLYELRKEGFCPDLVVGHGGWGETLFVRDVWPGCRIVLHAELFYSADDTDVDFDPEFPCADKDAIRLDLRARNSTMSLALLDADQGISPTAWQAGFFPPALREKIAIIHEGINTDLILPSPNAEVGLDRAGLRLRPGNEVVTFVARDLEPHRGYHIFMRTLPRILQQRPNAQVIIVGGDKVSYGMAAPGGRSWKDIFFDEVRDHIDVRRVHFVGRVPHRALLELLQVSAAHVYLTYPFVLSWSMLEAMAAGALVIGSRTAPVEDVISHRCNGILCDFFDIKGIADAVVDALAHPDHYRSLRKAGRSTIVERFDLQRVCLPAWLALLDPHQAATRDVEARVTTVNSHTDRLPARLHNHPGPA